MRLFGAIFVCVIASAGLYVNFRGMEHETASIRGVPVLVAQAALQLVLLLLTAPVYFNIFVTTLQKNYRPVDGMSTIAAASALAMQVVILISLSLYGQTRSRVQDVISEYREATLTRQDQYMILDGIIGLNTASRLVITYNEKPFEALVITSPGGLIASAIDIGRLIKNKQIKVIVVSHCESACAIVAFSSPQLTADGKAVFGFHRGAASVRDDNSLIRLMDREATKSYLQALTNLGIPADIISKAEATPPEDMYYVTAQDLFKRRLVKELIDLEE